ncbi:MAG: lipocalin family protein [Gemmatimonadaceae bacterium]|nr:lipocalin family protein [Chitinophagaceae bacterium]
MKATMLKTFALGLLVTTAFSCSKSKSTPTKSNTELLTQSAWKIDVAGVDLDKNGSIDETYPFEDCEKDDTYVFNINGTGVLSNNALKCDDNDPTTEDFTWSFKTNGTVLFASLTSIDGDATIKTLNDANLEVYQDVENSGMSIRYIFRFKH